MPSCWPSAAPHGARSPSGYVYAKLLAERGTSWGKEPFQLSRTQVSALKKIHHKKSARVSRARAHTSSLSFTVGHQRHTASVAPLSSSVYFLNFRARSLSFILSFRLSFYMRSRSTCTERDALNRSRPAPVDRERQKRSRSAPVERECFLE